MRNNDIIIRGIPLMENENDEKLKEVILKICTCIKCIMDANSIKGVFRFKAIKQTKGATAKIPNIIVKFANLDIKGRFMSCYYKFKTLSLNNIGLNSTNRIYCNENLTIANHKLLMYAIQHKGTKLHSAFSSNGHVFYRIASDARPIRLICVNEIDMLPLLSVENQPNSSEKSTENNGPPLLRSKVNNRTNDAKGRKK